MMEVVDKKYRKDCSFGSIKVGAVFKYNNEYYIKYMVKIYYMKHKSARIICTKNCQLMTT